MKIWVGVTDKSWYEHLMRLAPEEVNFWQPSGSRTFRVLQPGEPFLFKLHSPDNFIVGGDSSFATPTLVVVDGCEATIFARTRNCDVRLTVAFFAAIPFFTMTVLSGQCNANLRSPARNSQSKQLLAALAGTFPDRTWGEPT